MRVLKTLIVPSILLAAVLTFAQPASADAGATIKSITRNGCVVSITVDFEDARTYWLNIYDDLVETDIQPFVSLGNDTHTFVWTIVSNFNPKTPGVRITIQNEEAQFFNIDYDTIDEFDFPGSNNVANGCAAPVPESWITTPATVTTVTTAPTTPTTGTTVGQNTTTTATSPSTTVVPGANTPNIPNAPVTRPAAARPATAARPVSAKPTFTG